MSTSLRRQSPTRWFDRCGGRIRLAATLVSTTAVALLATPLARAEMPVATFSIVGADPEAGEVGIAVQSKFFAVGAVVPWASADAGAVATQAFANTAYGPRALDMLAAGRSPEEVIAALTRADEDRAQRQVGVVSLDGASAAHTGESCMAWAGHVTGPDYTAQGNILTGADVVAAMAEAFESTDGILGHRLMTALEAGQRAGGDSRGVQSAAILVVKDGAGYGGYNDRYCDLRVDDHIDPIGELRRIFDLWRWNALILEGYTVSERQDHARAFGLGERVVALRPDEGESYYHAACFRARAGERDAALDLLGQAIERDGALGARAVLDPDFSPLLDDPEFRRLTGSSATDE